ncbi:DNA replication/repair protein RecF [Azospirillum sp. BE72]|uniref:DNA replication/repair protein RecF n=1 Tax=Azospirillum sp. BE72 TaxID=2817776 RepID=UPI00286C468B|nr:DNA replication/repair protein RecF [Azospirillum sp. BE72]
MNGGASVPAAPLTPALAVRRMTLTRFRGYESARLEPDRRPVALIGPNGAGKTNLLEAVSFLAPGRGLRGARLAEVERLGSAPGAGWAVAATLDTPLGPVEIGTGREPHDGNRQGGGRTSDRDRRLVRIDGHPAKGQTALADHVAMVWLTPQMDRLFIEGSSGRRRFLDRLVFGFDPAHAGRLSRYEHALRERARLLRDGRFDEGWLGALEDQMATTGIAVAAARREVVQRLRAACARSVGPFPGADLAVAGTVERWLDEGPALAAEDMLRDSLRSGRRADADAGGATVGPHKSDLAVRHAPKDMPAAFCSTGEQKALLIAIVLANARLLAAERGAAPILLLDEVAAHLDPDRRAALFGEILALGAQAWMTGTDEGVFDPLGEDARRFRIEDAHIRPG